MKAINKLIETFKSFNEGYFDLWESLAYPNKNCGVGIFYIGLKEFVDTVNHSSLPLIESSFETLNHYLANQAFSNSLRDFYHCKGWPSLDEIGLNRLTTNAKALVASARMAILAKVSIINRIYLEALLLEAQETALLLGNKKNYEAIENTRYVDKLLDFLARNDNPTSLVTHIFNLLGEKGLLVTAAKYWTLYWLNFDRERCIYREVNLPLLGYYAGKGYVNHIHLELLNECLEATLIEHPESCLSPLNSSFIEGIVHAWQCVNENDKRSVCWKIQSPKHSFVQGGASSATIATGLASLYKGVVYNGERLVLGSIDKGSIDNKVKLLPVGFERAKLDVAQEIVGIKAVAIVERGNSVNRISDLDIMELLRKGLKVEFISTLSDAIEFVSIRPIEIHNIPPLPPNFLPRSKEIEHIKAILLNNKSVKITESYKVGLQGMGGIGKTVLAVALAHLAKTDSAFWQTFPDGIFWVTIGSCSDTSSLIVRQRELVESLTKNKNTVIHDLINGKNQLNNILSDKSCLLILDDVWNQEQLDAFDVWAPSCRKLITTRDKSLLNVVEAITYNVEALSLKEGMELLAKYAGQDLESLPTKTHEIAKETAKQCGLLPFGLALCGSIVRDGLSWSDLLTSLQGADLGVLQSSHASLENIIQSSLSSLGEKAKYYQTLAVFRPNAKIPEEAIITLLQYVYNLKEYQIRSLLLQYVNKSLLSVDTGVYELHGLLYVYLYNITEDKESLNNTLLFAYQQKCPEGSWASGPDDGYFFQNLIYHLEKANRKEDIRNLLLNFNWLQTKLSATTIAEILNDLVVKKLSLDLGIKL